MDYEVYSTREKIYVDYGEYGVIARLCEMSAEYYKVEDGNVKTIEIVLKSSLKEFQEKCRKYYGIEIDIEKHCPVWTRESV